jgi:hypothetical protein
VAANRRSDFLKRISSVGWGTRQSIQMLLGSVVTSIREQVAEDVFGDDELETVIGFHDDAEQLWQASLATDPPLDPGELLIRLQKLQEACSGPLAGFQIPLEQAVAQAETFAESKKYR